MVKGLSNLHAAQIAAARADRPFDSVEDVWRRSGVPVAALEKLAAADAFAALASVRPEFGGLSYADLAQNGAVLPSYAEAGD